ncbi:PIG-L family deacetylase [Gloeomargaritales cyanobacterium VI4D9]|nr:PIG-L family deacetylase [Gloeomargaritales cyanobacterium VI4D9]
MTKVLVVATHPDDEVLGCGGTLALHAARGDNCHILIMAEGLTSRSHQRDVEAHKEQLAQLRLTAQQACAVIGVKDVRFAGFPDNRMDSVDLLDVVKVVESVIEEIQPEIIYTHHYGDLNIDHQITHQAVMTATRPLPNSCIKKLLFFEVPSATGWNTPTATNAFIPQYYVDLSQKVSDNVDALERKLRALTVYESEMRPYPHNRSLEAVRYLAQWRGSLVGLPCAEAFQVGRILTLK